MKISFIITAVFVLILISILLFGSSKKNLFTSTPESTTSPTITSTPVMTKEEQCRNKVLSDNNLYEDRMERALKTCKETEICSYNDFRLWSKANGNYVPDWRSETYQTTETQKCIRTWPTDTPIPSPTIIESPTATPSAQM